MKQVPFPKYIDRQKMFGPLEIDEAASVLVGIFLMLVIGFVLALNVALSLVLGVVLGIFVAMALHGLKQNYPEGFIAHMAYRRGLYHPVTDNKTLIASHPEVTKKGLLVLPTGFLKVLTE